LTISVLFIFPVYLASQTIPPLSELIHGEQKAIIIGKLLFFSTIGSFMGSVVTSLVFFAYIGVDRSIIVNGIILAVLSLVILFGFYRKEARSWMYILNIGYIVFLVILLVSPVTFLRSAVKYEVYRQSTAYNDIVIAEYGTRKLFSMNSSNSSGIDTTIGKSYFSYIQDITRIIDEQKPKKILVIGAAGFTLPQDIAGRDYVDEVDVCDIDGALDKIAEGHFLGEKLHPKVNFYKQSARYFIREKILAGEQYDMIFIDAYNGKISIPSELLTKEFFDSIKKINRGTISMNLIIDPTWQSDFANTLSLSLGEVYVQSKTSTATTLFDNFIVITSPEMGFRKITQNNPKDIYTDNLNTLERDKYNLFYTVGLN
jgi:spermidine synthase